MKKIFLLIVLSIPFFGNAQIITTIAGIGPVGTTLGDGGPATAAKLARPSDVVTDTFGNIYIADMAHNAIRKVALSGIISTIAGIDTAEGYSGDGGPATAALLGLPSGLAVDLAGNIYIADEHNNRIRKVNTSGIITTIAGTDTAGYYGDGIPATNAQLYLPYQVAVDDYGNVYIADLGNNRIRMVNTTGTITTIAGTGYPGFSGDGGAATAAQLSQPYGLAIDRFGNVYVGDAQTRIRKINTAGIITTIAGNGISGYSGDGLSATDAEIFASGLAVDAAGNVYFADDFSNRVRKVSASGLIFTVAGDGTGGYTGDGIPATSAELYGPWGVAIDKSGFLYIAELYNARIRKVNEAIAAVSPLTIASEDVTIYPNPGNDNVTIKAPDVITSVTISDLLGKTVCEHKYNAMQVEVNTSTLANGIYLLKINSTTVRKFVKQ